jgi:rhodanese-related sulfurtransferase
VSLPFEALARDPSLARKLETGGRPVITYCGGGRCELAEQLASSLMDAGVRRVLVYTGGIAEWQQAGFPVRRGVTP